MLLRIHCMCPARSQATSAIACKVFPRSLATVEVASGFQQAKRPFIGSARKRPPFPGMRLKPGCVRPMIWLPLHARRIAPPRVPGQRGPARE